jgi:hypothetical protein
VSYQTLLLALALDVAVVGVLAFAIYFPRHRRRDLLLSFVGANVALFAVAAFVSNRELNLAVGVGLFALLSVVRLRSSEIEHEDIGYYFVALVLGLLNGFAETSDWARLITLDLTLLAVMYIFDHPRMLPHTIQQVVTLDDVYDDEAELRSDIERKLGAVVTKLTVQRVDFVHKHTVVDVRLRASQGRAQAGTRR